MLEEARFFSKIRQFCEETRYLMKKLKELTNVLNKVGSLQREETTRKGAGVIWACNRACNLRNHCFIV
jgi:hypothetical protein